MLTHEWVCIQNSVVLILQSLLCTLGYYGIHVNELYIQVARHPTPTSDLATYSVKKKEVFE